SPTAAPPAARATHTRARTPPPVGHAISMANAPMDNAESKGAMHRNRWRRAGDAPEPDIAAAVQPADSRAAPKPAASGDWPCSACRNSGTKASVQVTVTANRADTAYSAPSGPDSWNAPIGNNRRDADDSVRTNAQASIAARPRQGTLHGNGSTPAPDAPSTAHSSSTSWRHGSDGMAMGARVARGNASPAPAANAAAPSTTIQNARRQSPAPACRPPSSGPSTVATPHIPENSAITRGHRGGG